MSPGRRARLLRALADLEEDLGPPDPLDVQLDALLAERRPAELHQAAAELPAERAA